MNRTVRILYVDDNPMDRDLVRHALEKETGAFSLVEAATRDQFEAALGKNSYDAILSDFNILGFEGLEVIDAVRAKGHGIPVIIVTGTGSEEVAIEAMKRGAADYVIKSPTHIRRLPETIRRVLEKSRTRAALRDSEEAFRSLFESSMDAILLTAPDGRVFRANPAACQMFGMTEEEIVRAGREGLIDTTDPRLPALLEQRRLTGRAFGEITFIRKDGTRFPAEVGSSIFIDSKGEQKTSMSIRDISVRKASEHSLRENEERYRDLYENSPDMLISIDAATARIMQCNDACAKTTGYNKEEIVGRSILDLYHPDCHEQAQKYFKDFLETGEVTNAELLVLSKDGSTLNVILNSKALRDEQGKVLYSRSSWRDVTELRKAYEALTESEKRLRDVIDSTPFPIALVDTQDDKIFMWSHSAVELFGHTAPTAREWCQIAHPDPEYRKDVIDRWKHFLAIARSSGQTVNTGEYQVTCRDGSVRTCELYARFITDYLLVTFNDITDRKQAEEGLREAEQRYRSLFEEAPLMYVIIRDEEGMPFISDCNDFFLRALGYRRGEVLGKSLADFYSPESRMELLEGGGYRRARAGDFSFGERELVRRDGALIPALTYAARETDSSGNLVGIRVMYADITDRKQAEDDLIESERRYRALFENIPAGFVLFEVVQDEKGDPIDLIIVAANQGFEVTTGLNIDDMVGKRLTQVLPGIENDPADWIGTYGAVGLTGESRQFEQNSELLGCHYSITAYQAGPKQCAVTFLDITERKQAEEALKESEKQNRFLADVIETSSQAFGVGYTDGRLGFVNKAFCDLTGYSEEELRQIDWNRTLTPPEWRESEKSHLEELMRTGHPVRYEKEYIRKDGSRVPIELLVHVIRDDRGRTDHFRAFVTDLSDRKRSEETLRESEARYRYLVENIEDLICTHDLQGNLLYVSPGPALLLGYTPAEMVGTNLRSYLVTEVRDQLEGYLGYVRREGRASGHMRVQTRGGEIRIWECLSKLHQTPDGKEIVIGIARDVTERRRAEEAERRLATAIDQATEGIVITDAAGTIQYVNPGLERITGYRREELIGQNPRIFKSGEHDRLFYKGLWDTIKAGNIWSGRLVNRRKDGRLYHEDATISPVKDSSGKVINFVGVKRDITEHLDLAKQLQQAQKMEAIGTLAGGVAHDFNNILQVALGYSELMLGYEGLPSLYRADLQKIRESAKRGADLVQRLLTFSRKGESNPKPLDLNRRINEMRKMVERTIPKMIGIEIGLAKDLAAIHADPTQVDQVLMNLAVNARDAMPDGGRLVIETANITLDEEYVQTHLDVMPGRYVSLTVTDTGAGMDKETLEHIFEPFYTTKGVGEGTGLGLAMVHGIVRQHGGHIRCYSEPGEGTTFNIYFPALVSEAEREETSVRSMPRGGSETILLVDDEEHIAELCKRILGKAGYTVLTAKNGREALDQYTAHREEISLVILDLIMPEMGGKQCLEGLLNLEPSVKVVIASGYSANAQTKETLAAGAKGFVNKPYDIRQVLGVVRQVLDSE